MFEHRKHPLIPRGQFMLRVARFGAFGAGLLLVSLGVGMVGYHVLEGQPWLDALVEASMLLGGEGPVGELRTPAGKVFASVYAIFSGTVFIVAVGVFAAPVYHRFLHRFHLELDEEARDRDDSA